MAHNKRCLKAQIRRLYRHFHTHPTLESPQELPATVLVMSLKRCVTMGLKITPLLLSCTILQAGEAPPVNPVETQLARPLRRVPPQHWALQDFYTLVEQGVLLGQAPFFFQGGKSWTRGELAEVLAQLLGQLESKGADPDREILTILRRLRRELSAELDELKVEQTLAFPEVWKMREQIRKQRDREKKRPLGVHGSSTSAYTHALSNNDSTWKENLSVGFRKDGFKADATLLAEREPESPFPVGLREFRFGPKAKGTLDKYALSWEKVEEDGERFTSIFGFTGGSSWSRGLVVGNLNLEGANFIWQPSEDENIEWVMGRTQGEKADRLMAAHYSKRWSEEWTALVQAVGAWYHDESSSGSRGLSDESLWGAGLEYSADELEASSEWGMSSRGGWGWFGEALLATEHWGELRWSGRHYDDFEFDYHSLEVYSGISGGDDINERGMALEWDMAYRENLGLNLVLDSSYGGSAGRLLYAFSELTVEEDWADLSLSYEKEWTRQFLNQITSMRVSRSFELWRASVDWSRDKVEGEGSDSTRLALYWDVLREILSLSSSVSNRHSSSGRNLTQQFGLNWNITSFQFLSLQSTFSRPDSSDDSAELNYLVKF